MTILSALLLSPLLKSIITDTQKPIVVLALDVSESIAAEMSGAALETYKNDLEQLSNQLDEEYDLVEYSFGEDMR